MKYEECKRQLTNCGYELLGSSSEGVTMTNGIVKVTFYNTKTSYGSGTDSVQRMYTYIGMSGDWDDYLAQDDDNTIIPDCPQVNIDDQVRILTGSPTEIVKKFRELQLEKTLDEVLG